MQRAHRHARDAQRQLRAVAQVADGRGGLPLGGQRVLLALLGGEVRVGRGLRAGDDAGLLGRDHLPGLRGGEHTARVVGDQHGADLADPAAFVHPGDQPDERVVVTAVRRPGGGEFRLGDPDPVGGGGLDRELGAEPALRPVGREIGRGHLVGRVLERAVQVRDSLGRLPSGGLGLRDIGRRGLRRGRGTRGRAGYDGEGHHHGKQDADRANAALIHGGLQELTGPRSSLLHMVYVSSMLGRV